MLDLGDSGDFKNSTKYQFLLNYVIVLVHGTLLRRVKTYRFIYHSFLATRGKLNKPSNVDMVVYWSVTKY
jgi:hypothetical protein